MVISHHAEVADADESPRQNVKQESPDELVSRYGHRSHLVAAGVIPPTEGNAFAIEGDEPVVGDGDTVSITTEIANDLFRPAEGGLWSLDIPSSRFGINGYVFFKIYVQEAGD